MDTIRKNSYSIENDVGNIRELLRTTYVLTEEGEKVCNEFLERCKRKRNTLLSKGLDTANEVELPNLIDIMFDIAERVSDEGMYTRTVKVSDNTHYLKSLQLKLGKDFKEAFRLPTLGDIISDSDSFVNENGDCPLRLELEKDFEEAFKNPASLNYALTAEGIRKCNAYIRECEAKKKEILDAKLDTADETMLPTLEDIISDLDSFVDEDGDYYNSWGVTDNFNADCPLCLSLGIDFVECIVSPTPKHKPCTLESILAKYFGCENPFLEDIEVFEDGGKNPFTDEGAKAYSKLVELLYDVGEITGESMDSTIEALDNISNEEF